MLWTADVQYRNFRNEIQGFAQLLQQLDNALTNAHLQYTRRSLAIKATGAAYDPLANDFDTERCHFIGDFTATLEECKTVLQQNKNLHTRGSNIFRNVDWKLRVESKVTDLRKRIEFHSTKILLVIDRLSLTLLTDIDAKVDDLLGLSEQNLLATHEIRDLLNNFYNSWKGSSTGRPQVLDPSLEDRHVVSPAIQSQLLRRAENHPDKKVGNFDFPGQIPLAEGFDALLHHFEKSLDVVERDQTPDHYLCLLKARWLLENIKLSHEYENARPGFYYKRAIARIEQAIRVRLRSNAVIKFDDDVLLALPKSSFNVWYRPEQISAVRHDPTMPRADETEIIRLDLASEDAGSQDKVTVLQRSSSHFRIVVESVADDHREFIDKTYVATEDKLIPRYALPELTIECFEIAIFSRGEELLYRFNNMKDVFLFQSALVGYEISHHVRGIRCGFSETYINGTGDIQIWQDPIDSKPSQSSPTMPPLTLTNSNSTRGSRSNTRQSSIAASIGATTVSRVADGYQAKPIAYPAITVFTRLPDRHGRSRLALIYLKLDKDIGLFLDQCGCKNQDTYNECPILSIERPKRAKFPVYVLYSDLERSGQSNPNTWDLSLFRIPEHPRFKQLQRVETTYLLLQFPSLAKKRRFHDELNDRFLLRQAQILEQAGFLKQMRYRQDRPSRNSDNIPQPYSHSRSTSFASTTTSEAVALAQLKALDLGIDFQTEIEKSYAIRSDDDDDDGDNSDGVGNDDPTPVASQILQRPTVHQATTTIPPTQRPNNKKLFKWPRKLG